MLAKKHQTMEAKFKYTKAYYFRNRSGTLQKITTSAYVVPDLQTELIGCKNLTKSGYCIILDKDPEISGIYQEGPIFRASTRKGKSCHSVLMVGRICIS